MCDNFAMAASQQMVQQNLMQQQMLQNQMIQQQALQDNQMFQQQMLQNQLRRNQNSSYENSVFDPSGIKKQTGDDSFAPPKTDRTGAERTTEEKQAIIKKARVKSAGWSMLFGPLTTIACALRSDKKVAKKYGLDPEADKDLIRNIKLNQVKATIPSLFGVGLIGFICNACKKSSKIDA